MDDAEYRFAEHVKAELAAIKRLLGDKFPPACCEPSDSERMARLERIVEALIDRVQTIELQMDRK